MTYDSVLFDVDGVLLDFHSDHPTVYRQAVEATFGAFDVSPSVDDLNAFIAGATMDEMRRACARHDIDFERFWPEREENASALQSGMMDRGERVLYDDSSVLFDLADHHDMGLVSSNQHATIEYMVERFDLAHLFEAVYGRDPTVEGFDRTKPETYYIEKAMNDLDVTTVSTSGTARVTFVPPTGRGWIRPSSVGNTGTATNSRRNRRTKSNRSPNSTTYRVSRIPRKELFSSVGVYQSTSMRRRLSYPSTFVVRFDSPEDSPKAVHRHPFRLSRNGSYRDSRPIIWRSRTIRCSFARPDEFGRGEISPQLRVN